MDFIATTRISRRYAATRERLYQALITPADVARWRFPAGMTCHVHEFDAREGGRLRVSLTYNGSGGTGKTSTHTDTYHGRFVTLVPHELVVEVDEFEMADLECAGEMTMTIRLTDNEAGWREALERLAGMVDGTERSRRSSGCAGTCRDGGPELSRCRTGRARER